MSKIYKVAVDVDGVLWDLITPWLEQYAKITNESIDAEDVKEYDLSNIVSHYEVMCYILEMKDFWDKVKPYDFTADALNILLERDDIDMVVCTNTSYRIAHIKFKRLFEVLPMLKRKHLIITERKDLVDVDFFIDDYENNLRHMTHEHSNGTGILIDQPYNRSFPNNQYGIVRCKNLLEAVNMITDCIDRKNK